jgi:multisubunit Na+/H+ antiporter MnhB subunit
MNLALALAVDIGLSLLILAMAAWTIAVRDTFAAVIGFVTYGLLLTLVWVRLAAPDVALTEAAMGGGLTGALLIGAAAKLRDTEAATRTERPSALTRTLAAALSFAVTAALALCVLNLPDPAPTLAPEAAAHLAATGVGNPVTAVLLAYRAMDTLLEAIVVILALLGVWSLAHDHAWGGHPRLRPTADPDGILAYFARIMAPVGIIVGIYIFWVGADLPGGKFQGATILAAMWLLVAGAGLADLPHISRPWLRILLVTGPLVFIAIGWVGSVTAEAFFAYPKGYAKPLILAIEIALLPTLVLTLALLVAGAPQRMPPR